MTDTQAPVYHQPSQPTQTPFSSSPQPQPPSLEITYDSWRHTHMTITPTNTTTPLYHITTSTLHNKLTFKTPTSPTPLATSTLHCYKSSFTTHLHSHTIPVTSDKIWRIQRSCTSPAFNGRKFLWKTTRACGALEFVCLDGERGVPVARVLVGGGWKRFGRVEFTGEGEGEKGLSGEQIEELVVVGLTVAYQVVQNRMTAAGVGASAASSSAAAAAASVAV